MRDHGLRLALPSEVHARPPEPMVATTAISHVVMRIDRDERLASQQQLARLIQPCIRSAKRECLTRH